MSRLFEKDRTPDTAKFTPFQKERLLQKVISAHYRGTSDIPYARLRELEKESARSYGQAMTSLQYDRIPVIGTIRRTFRNFRRQIVHSK